MKIILKNCKNQDVTYDLNKPSERSKVKGFITRNIKKPNFEALRSIKTQLEAGNTEINYIKTEVDRINETLESEANIAKIIIKVGRTEYNINNPARHKCLIATIKRYGKNKIEELNKLARQIDKASLQHTENPQLISLKKQIKEIIDASEKDVNYQPYTTLLESEFILSKSVEEKKIQPYNEDPINEEDYLNSSVTADSETGQDNIDKLSACFWLDFMKNTGFLSGDLDRKHVILYLVLVNGFFSHNASYYPAQGYGMSSKAECEHPLFYIRSQAKHHEISHYKSAKNDRLSYGRQNKSYLAMIEKSRTFINEHSRNLATRINADGSLRDTVRGERLGETLAHLGSRANNAVLFHQLLETAYDESLHDNFIKLKSYIEDKEKTKKFNKIRLESRIPEILDSFKKLHLTEQLYPNIMNNIMEARYKTALFIKTQCDSKNLENIAIDVPEESGFFYVRCYPSFTDTTRKESTNIKEGLTNVILGFFGALVNFYAKQENLHYRLARRQSFGFLRPTITDTGSLRLRISLGADSKIFQSIYVKALVQLNNLLEEFDFITPDTVSDVEIKNLIKNCLQPCEDSKGSKSTEKTGDYLRSAMRCEDDQWIALLVGEKYLKMSEGDATAAYKLYLENFIYKRAHRKKSSEAEHKTLPREGYTFLNKSRVKLGVPSVDNRLVLIQSQPLLQLLNNLVESTVAYVKSLGILEVSESIHFVLFKLLRNCQLGLAVLNNAHNYELSHILAKANNIIETIQEFLLPLKVLAKDIDSATEDLKQIDQARFSSLMEGVLENIQVFYNDGGLQSINTGLLAMGFEGMRSVYLFDDCYYEIEKFCEESGIKRYQSKDILKADIWLCDTTKIYTLQASLNAAILDAKKVVPRSILIDITNNSTSAALEKLQPVIKQAQEHGIWVILSCSTLKHEQLGQDKYQSGRNVIITPPSKSLNSRTTLKHLNAVSTEAMNSLFASCRQIVETVSCRQECQSALKTHGLFKSQHATEHTPTPPASFARPSMAASFEFD